MEIVNDVYQYLNSICCCTKCILIFLGERNIEVYKTYESINSTLKNILDNETFQVRSKLYNIFYEYINIILR